MAITHMETPRRFKEPTSLADAEARRDRVWSEIQALETQLANPGIVDPGTNRKMLPGAYKRWRFRAIKVLSDRHAEHRALRNWINQKSAGKLTRVTDLSQELINAGIADVIPEAREDLKLIVEDLVDALRDVQTNSKPVKSVRQL